jgi:hypothetical protein
MKDFSFSASKFKIFSLRPVGQCRPVQRCTDTASALEVPVWARQQHWQCQFRLKALTDHCLASGHCHCVYCGHQRARQASSVHAKLRLDRGVRVRRNIRPGRRIFPATDLGSTARSRERRDTAGTGRDGVAELRTNSAQEGRAGPARGREGRWRGEPALRSLWDPSVT